MPPTQETINEFVGAAHGDFSRLQALLAEDPDLLNVRASWGEAAIEAAAQTGQAEIAEFLLARGAPLDICTAAMLGLYDEVARLLAGDPSLAQARGAHGLPVLYFPVIGGRQAIAELLISSGADPNANEGRTTPLHGAVMFRRVDMAQWLLERDAYPNPKNHEGKTPLQLATESGQLELAALLRAAGGKEVS